MSTLVVRNATKVFRSNDGRPTYALNGVDLTLERGSTVGVIGESGSGKSTLGRVVLGLIAPDQGSVEIDGLDLASLDRRRAKQVRSRVTAVFQEPLDALNPRMRVVDLIGEPLRIHRRSMDRTQRWRAVIEAMDHAQLDRRLWNRYPRELSGGQQQRVGIARALILKPEFMVLDEPTASLDMSVRGQILDTLNELQDEFRIGFLFISHDISTVRELSDQVAVMYRGTVAELGSRDAVFKDARHPYSHALLSAMLPPDPDAELSDFKLRGDIGSTHVRPTGCPLVKRCPLAVDSCAEGVIPVVSPRPDLRVRCVRALESREELAVLGSG